MKCVTMFVIGSMTMKVQTTVLPEGKLPVLIFVYVFEYAFSMYVGSNDMDKIQSSCVTARGVPTAALQSLSQTIGVGGVGLEVRLSWRGQCMALEG